MEQEEDQAEIPSWPRARRQMGNDYGRKSISIFDPGDVQSQLTSSQTPDEDQTTNLETRYCGLETGFGHCPADLNPSERVLEIAPAKRFTRQSAAEAGAVTVLSCAQDGNESSKNMVRTKPARPSAPPVPRTSTTA
jgi:hypothetical protein